MSYEWEEQRHPQSCTYGTNQLVEVHLVQQLEGILDVVETFFSLNELYGALQRRMRLDTMSWYLQLRQGALRAPISLRMLVSHRLRVGCKWHEPVIGARMLTLRSLAPIAVYVWFRRLRI